MKICHFCEEPMPVGSMKSVHDACMEEMTVPDDDKENLVASGVVCPCGGDIMDQGSEGGTCVSCGMYHPAPS